jgi:hypothetical protein
VPARITEYAPFASALYDVRALSKRRVQDRNRTSALLNLAKARAGQKLKANGVRGALVGVSNEDGEQLAQLACSSEKAA